MVILLPFFMILGFHRQKQSPGVAPLDCALLFYWTKRVSKKGPTLRWACLARKGGNFNPDQIILFALYTSPAGTEALESLCFYEGLHRL